MRGEGEEPTSKSERVAVGRGGWAAQRAQAPGLECVVFPVRRGVLFPLLLSAMEGGVAVRRRRSSR